MRVNFLAAIPIGFALLSAIAAAAEVYGPADPIQKDAARFDAKRPIRQEMQTDVPDDFTVGSVGDLIISRPLSQYAARLPGFAAVLGVLRGVDVLYGNLETTVFDARYFAGAPYSWDDDWTNSSEPAVPKDLKVMGFGIVSRANNHSLDWGLEGMRETNRHLDQAGIVYAGVGEDRGLARAPQFLETPKARVALVSIASTFRPTTDALPRHGAAPGRPGLSALHVTRTIVLPAAAMQALAQIDCAVYRHHCHETPAALELFEVKYRLGKAFAYDYAMDPEDLADIEKNIRSARQNADLVIVSIHSHECSLGCDDPNQPRGAGNFLLKLAHQAIDSGADVFVTTGNHNLGAIELYRSPLRGMRPIFYGLGNFFWSDVQTPLPHDLYQDNRALLESAWMDAAVQLGHRLHQAQAEADARSAAAGIAAVEALDDLGLFRIGDAGPLSATEISAAASPRRRTATSIAPFSGAILERVVDQVAERLGEQDRIAGTGTGPSERKVRSMFLSSAAGVELHGGGRQVRDIERHEAGTAHAGIDFRQAQQGIEDADHAVDVRDGAVDFGEGLSAGGRISASSSSRERSSASGVRRSWAMEFDTLRTPCTSSSICSSMPLMVRDRVLSSSSLNASAGGASGRRE
jgi:poly-gamma-glutamate capsule biosynthesis protein CapA/YwtB (metallophosphatase superfamily)